MIYKRGTELNHIKNNNDTLFPSRVIRGKSDDNNLCCLIADGSGNFLNSGITEGTLIYIDRSLPFEKGEINVFRINGTYILSELNVSNGKFVGRAVMSVNRYI